MPSKLLLRSRLAHVELGREVTDADYDTLVTGEVDVFKPDGSRLCSVRRAVISAPNREIARRVLRPLRSARSMNRGLAAGGDRERKVRKNGVLSNTSEAEPVASAIIGYFDRYPRIPYCRQTAFNADNTTEFKELLPTLGELAHHDEPGLALLCERFQYPCPPRGRMNHEGCVCSRRARLR